MPPRRFPSITAFGKTAMGFLERIVDRVKDFSRRHRSSAYGGPGGTWQVQNQPRLCSGEPGRWLLQGLVDRIENFSQRLSVKASPFRLSRAVGAADDDDLVHVL
jgi:hypothetical protein